MQRGLLAAVLVQEVLVFPRQVPVECAQARVVPLQGLMGCRQLLILLLQGLKPPLRGRLLVLELPVLLRELSK